MAGIQRLARPLDAPRDLDPLLDSIGDARFVLLGEASHGTSEFYTWRTEISKRLIEERGFSFIAVEGDWPDCYRVNRYVKAMRTSGQSAEEVLHAFERWPTWMWANREIVELAEWLRAAQSTARRRTDRLGSTGSTSIRSGIRCTRSWTICERVDPELARRGRQAYIVLRAVRRGRAGVCARDGAGADVVRGRSRRGAARAPRERAEFRDDGREGYFNAEQNALVARNAELYYRTMVRGGPSSWNVRDRHMVETLDRLMQHHGPTRRRSSGSTTRTSATRASPTWRAREW